jgi:TPR repeat protein
LLDVTTTLDSRFLLAYRMGAIFLSEGYPGGPGRPDLAIALLEKGLRQTPNRWQLMHDIGFVYFWTLRDYHRAAAWLDKASQAPDGPQWLKPVVAGMLLRGGDRATARLLWREILNSDEAMLRQSAELHLAQLDALDQIDELHSLIARVTLATGVRPESWNDLIARGWLRGVPADPSGMPYVMDPFTARVTVFRDSALFPLPSDLQLAAR